MINSLRGMNDLIADDSKKFTYFIEVASSVAKKYGFSYIKTPLLEESVLFKRSVGDSSDIIGKEMYQFFDKGGNDVSLRPEGTAGVVRAFIEKKLDRQGGVHRFFYHGNMYRYERPQKGRLREFSQFGCESFGEGCVYEDATIIMLVSQIFNELGIKFKLKLNSLGCNECMPLYKERLVSFVNSFRDSICEDCTRRLSTNPIRVLDCKNEKCQGIYKDAPKLKDNLCKNCLDDFLKLQDILKQNSIDFEIDTHLVRGLDYYTKSAFEFISANIGSQNAIAGGGRYDRLVGFLDGKETPAIGFAIGIERILDLIELKDSTQDSYYLGAMDDESIDEIIKLSYKQRAKNIIYVEYRAKNLKNHLKNADKLQVKYCCIIGSNELANRSIWVKNMISKEEQSIKIEDFDGIF